MAALKFVVLIYLLQKTVFEWKTGCVRKCFLLRKCRIVQWLANGMFSFMIFVTHSLLCFNCSPQLQTSNVPADSNFPFNWSWLLAVYLLLTCCFLFDACMHLHHQWKPQTQYPKLKSLRITTESDLYSYPCRVCYQQGLPRLVFTSW